MSTDQPTEANQLIGRDPMYDETGEEPEAEQPKPVTPESLASEAETAEHERNTVQAELAKAREEINRLKVGGKDAESEMVTSDQIIHTLRAELSSAMEENAVLKSQVENADVNLEQAKLIAKSQWRTKLESCEAALAKSEEAGNFSRQEAERARGKLVSARNQRDEAQSVREIERIKTERDEALATVEAIRAVLKYAWSNGWTVEACNQALAVGTISPCSHLRAFKLEVAEVAWSDGWGAVAQYKCDPASEKSFREQAWDQYRARLIGETEAGA